MRITRALACTALLLLFAARCDDRDDAIAAAPPEIEIRGAVASAQTAVAIASIDGRVSAIDAREGMNVGAGSVVATLVNPAVERDVAYARAQVALAEQRLRQAARPPARVSITQASAAREKAMMDILSSRQSKRDRYRELFKTRDVSKEELENAEAEYSAALRDLLGERERTTTTIVQTDTGLLQLELEKAKAEESLAADRRSMLRVVAPMAGVITRVHVRPGDAVFPRDAIVEIANNATAEVRGQIAPELMRYVRPGTQVQVKVFTVPPRRFTAPVRAVVPGAGTSGATIVVELPNPDGVLQAGQPAVFTVR